jgi:hypothetical protein
MSRDIHRKLEESRGEAAQAKDLLRRSFDRHLEEQREARERVKQSRASRARNYFQEAAGEATNNEKEGE